jgi:hypothetical protein
MHVLTVKTLEEQLNQSLVHEYTRKHLQSSHKHVSQTIETSKLTRYDRKRDLWPLPIQLNKMSTREHEPVAHMITVPTEQHKVDKDYNSTYVNSPLMIRSYDYDRLQHMVIYENSELKDVIKRLVIQRLMKLIGEIPKEIKEAMHALLVRSSLELIEEILEMMGTLRDYVAETMLNRPYNRLKMGNYRTVLRAAQFIGVDPELIKKTQDRLNLILNRQTPIIVDKTSLMSDISEPYLEEEN